MACHEEHCYLLNVAIARSTWGRTSAVWAPYGGWKSLGKDIFNRMATFSDTIGDWMWHMSPWAEAAVQLGAVKIAEDLRRGDGEAAALKAAFLSHYVVDPLAVSHTWLYLIGEIGEFESDEVLHKVYHDPVENLVAKHLDDLTLDPPSGCDSFTDLFEVCMRDALAIGRRILNEFRGAKNFLPLVKEGVRNSARCMPAFFDDLHEGKLSCPDTTSAQWAAQRWPARLFLDWSSTRLRSDLFQPDTLHLLKKDMGYLGADIFFHPERCSPLARSDYERFREAREIWRNRMGIAERVRPRQARPFF